MRTTNINGTHVTKAKLDERKREERPQQNKQNCPMSCTPNTTVTTGTS
jgi:hypothetical protein